MSLHIHITFNRCIRPSRIIKQSRSLLKSGIHNQVKVLCVGDLSLEKKEKIDENFTIERSIFSPFLYKKNALFGLFRYIAWVFIVCRKIQKTKPVSVSLHSINTLIFAPLLKAFFRTYVIYDAHELETEKNGLRPFRKKMYKIQERSLIKFVDKTIVVNESIKDYYMELYPNYDNISVVKNVPFLSKTKSHSKDLLRKSLNIPLDCKIFLYQGALTKGRGIEELINVFKKNNFKNCALVFMGYGILENKIISSSNDHPSIYFHEAVKLDELLDYTSSSDVGLCLIENTCLSYYYCLPNKIFEYMATGIPVIASDFPEIKKVVDEYGKGVLCNPEKEEEIKKAIGFYLKNDASNIEANDILQKYNWNYEEKEFLKIFKNIQ